MMVTTKADLKRQYRSQIAKQRWRNPEYRTRQRESRRNMAPELRRLHVENMQRGLKEKRAARRGGEVPESCLQEYRRLQARYGAKLAFEMVSR